MPGQIPTFPLTFDEIPYPGGIKFKSQGLRRRSYPGPSRSKINPTSKRLNHFGNNNLSGYCKTHSGFESFPIYFQGSSFFAALCFWIELRSKSIIRLFNENGNSIWQWYLWKHLMYWALGSLWSRQPHPWMGMVRVSGNDGLTAAQLPSRRKQVVPVGRQPKPGGVPKTVWLFSC